MTDTGTVITEDFRQRPRADGRRQRSVRSKGIIMDACRSMLRLGIQQPTIQSVADMAGIPVRRVYFHFPDRDSLLMAAIDDLETREALLEKILQDDLVLSPETELALRIVRAAVLGRVGA